MYGPSQGQNGIGRSYRFELLKEGREGLAGSRWLHHPPLGNIGQLLCFVGTLSRVFAEHLAHALQHAIANTSPLKVVSGGRIIRR